MWSLYENEKELKPLVFSNGKSQADIVKEVIEAVEQGYKIIFIRGMCGTGKSAIALNLARKLGRTSIVVPIKSLQEQYKKDYSGETGKKQILLNGKNLRISSIVGRQNFKCRYLQENDIKYISIHGRVKHLTSLYKKIIARDRDINKIYDLIALRVIVNSVADCYTVLGLIHKKWKPLKGRIKDYIAQPKPNGYQSLHTTVFAERGKIIEFQIRTKEMHDLAEFGVAAHWHYKDAQGKTITRKTADWINKLLEIQKKFQDNKKYLSELKFEIFQNRIFVFTPKGDVIDLPEYSTPIDFAYHIHTDIGNKCSGVLINEEIATLDTPLKSGDVVEILTDKNRRKPNQDWLSFVKTNAAKEKIKQELKKEEEASRLNLLNRKKH